MVTVDDFSRVVSEVYAAALEPDNWTRTMSEISRVAGAAGSGLVIGADPDQLVLLGSHMPDEAVESYQDYYHRLDHVRAECARSPVGLIRGGREVNAGRTHTEFHADWQKPFELTDGLFVQIAAGPLPASFAISGPQRDERFDDADRVAFVNALIRHLQQALRTQRHLAGVGQRSIALSTFMDNLPHGVVIVGASGHVVHANASALDLFASTDGLVLRNKTIEAPHAPTDSTLQKSISDALCHERGDSRSGTSLLVSRPSRRRPYVVHVLPVETPLHDFASAQAVIVIVDPERQPATPKALLRRMFGLTNAETEVALRVTAGRGLGLIADEMAVSTATVKTHLQRIFEKTNTHRQAELARLLLTVDPLTRRHRSDTA